MIGDRYVTVNKGFSMLVHSYIQLLQKDHDSMLVKLQITRTDHSVRRFKDGALGF